MSESGFWWSHWGHLMTKPLESLAIWLGLTLLGVPGPLAAGAALLLPLIYNMVRKARLWPLKLHTWALP